MKRKKPEIPVAAHNRIYSRRAFFILLSVLFLGLVLNTINYVDTDAATTGGAGGGTSENDPSAGSSSSSSSSSTSSNNGKHIRWVYFKIKDGADEYIAKNYKGKNAWKVAGKDVSACSRTQGVYFSFEAFSNSKTLKTAQSTLPYNGYKCAKGCVWGC